MADYSDPSAWFKETYGGNYDWGDSWRDEWRDYKDYVRDVSDDGFGGLDKRADAKDWFRSLGGGPPSIDEYEMDIISRDTDGDGIADSVGYWDADNNWVETADFSRVNDLMNTAEEQAEGLTSLEEYLANNGLSMNDVTGSDAFRGLNDLVELLQNPDATAEDIEAAEQYAAQSLGVGRDELEEMLADMQARLSQGFRGYQGFTEEERATRDRAFAAEQAQDEMRARRMVSNIAANTGSATRAYMAADQNLRSIQDKELQYRVSQADEEFRRQMEQYSAEEQRMQFLVQAGQAGAAQYLQMLSNNRATALQGYATQLNTMMQENQQYLSMYSADMQTVQAMVNNTYQAINAELGLMDAVRDEIQFQFDQNLAQYELAMEEWERQMEAAEDDFDWLTAVIAGVAIIGGIALMAVPGGQLAGATLFAQLAPSIGMGLFGLGTETAIEAFTG